MKAWKQTTPVRALMALSVCVCCTAIVLLSLHPSSGSLRNWLLDWVAKWEYLERTSSQKNSFLCECRVKPASQVARCWVTFFACTFARVVKTKNKMHRCKFNRKIELIGGIDRSIESSTTSQSWLNCTLDRTGRTGCDSQNRKRLKILGILFLFSVEFVLHQMLTENADSLISQRTHWAKW